MKTEIDHLPAKQQGELEHVKRVLMEEFARSIERATKPGKRNGKILKIILFGSYARDDWVDEHENGYQSDFHLLIIVSHEDLTRPEDHTSELHSLMRIPYALFYLKKKSKETHI